MEDHDADFRSPPLRLVRINRARPAAGGGRAAPAAVGVLLLCVQRPFREGEAIGGGTHLVDEDESPMDMLFSFENQVGGEPLVREGMSTCGALISFEHRFGDAHVVEETGIFVGDVWRPSENHDSTPVLVTERFRTLPIYDRDVVYEQVVATASDGGGVSAGHDELIAKNMVEDLSKLPLVKIRQLQEGCKVRVKVMVEDVKKDMVDIESGRVKGREIVVCDETGSVTFTAYYDQIEKCEKEAFLELQGAVLQDSMLLVPNYPYGRIEVTMPPVEPKKEDTVEQLGLLDQLMKDLEELPLTTIDQVQEGTKVKVNVRVEELLKDKLKIDGKRGAAREAKVCDGSGSVRLIAINDQIEKCEREADLELQGAVLHDSMLLVPIYPYGRIKATIPPVQLQEHDDNIIHEVPLMKIKELEDGMTGVRLRAKVIRNKAWYGEGICLGDETKRLHFSPGNDESVKKACQRNALIEVNGGIVCIENKVLKLKLGNSGSVVQIFPPLFQKGSKEEMVEEITETSQQDKRSIKKKKHRQHKVVDKKDGGDNKNDARGKSQSNKKRKRHRGTSNSEDKKIDIARDEEGAGNEGSNKNATGVKLRRRKIFWKRRKGKSIVTDKTGEVADKAGDACGEEGADNDGSKNARNNNVDETNMPKQQKDAARSSDSNYKTNDASVKSKSCKKRERRRRKLADKKDDTGNYSLKFAPLLLCVLFATLGMVFVCITLYALSGQEDDSASATPL